MVGRKLFQIKNYVKVGRKKTNTQKRKVVELERRGEALVWGYVLWYLLCVQLRLSSICCLICQVLRSLLPMRFWSCSGQKYIIRFEFFCLFFYFMLWFLIWMVKLVMYVLLMFVCGRHVLYLLMASGLVFIQSMQLSMPYRWTFFYIWGQFWEIPLPLM